MGNRWLYSDWHRSMCLFFKKDGCFLGEHEAFPVRDIKGYNHALGKLFIFYGMLFVVLGMPLLSAQNTPYILLSVFGVMIETIVFMVIYSLFIEKKYKKQ